MSPLHRRLPRHPLRDGKDPEMRRIAEKIVCDQGREMREFRDWLARHPAP